MKNNFTLLLLLIFALAAAAQPVLQNNNSCVAGEVVVEFKNNSSTFIPAQYGITAMKKICRDKSGNSNVYLLSFDVAVNAAAKVAQLMQTGYFNRAEPNGYVHAHITPNDNVFPQQYGLQNTGNFNLTFSTNDSDSDLPAAWNIEQGDTNIIVADLDGGIAFGHPEFAGRIWNNYNEIPANGIDDDNNGYIDDRVGWNFSYNNNNPADDLGHGTSTAGVIGANANNSIGIAGVDWYCKLMICKVLDSTNGGSFAAIADAVYYAVNNGADVLNMSFGGPYSSTLAAAIQYAWNHNVVMCASTGNNNSPVVQFPAGDSLVLAVGGSNAWDVRYIYSNYGPHVDVVAAGDFIYDLDYSNFNNYGNYSSGTSLASPMVAGVAALLKAQDTSRTNQEIYDIIRMTADDTVDVYTGEDTPGWDMYFGYGRLNAYRALSYDTAPVVTGLAAQNSANGFSVFPNPAAGRFYVRMSGAGTTGVPVIEVYSVIGELIFTDAVLPDANALYAIDLSAQPAGIYFIRVAGEAMSMTQKVIIEN